MLGHFLTVRQFPAELMTCYVHSVQYFTVSHPVGSFPFISVFKSGTTQMNMWTNCLGEGDKGHLSTKFVGDYK